MPTDVVMPQMGESIAEGTIVRWIKKLGDAIDKDEPLFEISTDKVDAEIPSPGAGVLLEIKVKEGETVPVNSVVAVIGGAGEKVATGSTGSAGSSASAGSAAGGRVASGERVEPAEPVEPIEPVHAPQTLADLRRTRSSPVVRKIAKQHGIDITRLNGTGISGRVTKRDIEAFVAGQVAHFKQLRHVTFVEEIPKSASGKILRRVLRDAPPGE